MSDEVQHKKLSTHAERWATPDRRSVMTAAAWSTPVVTAAALAPSLAASPVVIISPNILVITEFNAKWVVCGDAASVVTSMTISNTEDIRMNLRVRVTIVPPGTDTSDIPGIVIEDNTPDVSPPGGFQGVSIQNVSTTTTVEYQPNARFGILVGATPWSSDHGLLRAAADDPVTEKAWVEDIAAPDPVTYELANFEYSWPWVTSPGTGYVLRGSFDLRDTAACTDPSDFVGEEVNFYLMKSNGSRTPFKATVGRGGHVTFAANNFARTTVPADLRVSFRGWSTTLNVDPRD